MDPIITVALVRIQTDFNQEVPITTAVFEKTTIISGESFASPIVEHRYAAVSEKTVTSGGLTLTYAQMNSFVTAMANGEKEAAEAAV